MVESSLITKLIFSDLFSSMDEVTLAAIENELELIQLASDAILFRQGDPGDSMFVLVKGFLTVSLRTSEGREITVGEMNEPGSTIGEMALITGQERPVTVSARNDADLIKVTKVGFKILTVKHPLLEANLAKMTAGRWQEAQLAVALDSLYGDLDPDVLGYLLTNLEWRQLSRGEFLFEQGDIGDAMYIVVGGRLRITAEDSRGREQILDEIGSGEIVGEFALITGEPRTANVYAIRETNLAKMTAPIFTRLIEQHPESMIKITRKIISRHPSSVRISKTEALSSFNICLLPISPEIALEEFSLQLADSLNEFGRVKYLSSSRFDMLYGLEGAAHITLDDPISPIIDSWISDQESKFQFIIFTADPTWSAWTKRCLRQADRLLLVGRSRDDPKPRATELEAMRLTADVTSDLVLLYPDHADRPVGTSDWLDRKRLHAHHHIGIGNQKDFRRLARWLTGRTVGLVLSGGGARGFAHLGAFRALEEMGVEIDYVGGTSMGSLLGAGYAMGLDSGEQQRLAEVFASPRELFDYTLPLTSLMASKKVTQLLRTLFEDRNIEDLWLPFFCISSNMTRAAPVLHQRGLLWRSIRASIAIPGIFTPILNDGDLLADGGPLNNFPVDVMRQFCKDGTVIGVNVSPSEEMKYLFQDRPDLSGWQILWSRLNPLVNPIESPSLIANIMRAIEINSVYQINNRQRLADVLIQPDVGQYGTLDFSSHKPISEAGYLAAREELARWLETQRSAA